MLIFGLLNTGSCIGFAWQGFGSRGYYRGGFREKQLEASPMLYRHKTDPPLAKAEPISDSGSTSVITRLRRGKKKCSEREE